MKDESIELTDAIKVIERELLLTAQEFENGPKIDPLIVIQGYNSSEWEAFVDEWIHSLEHLYIDVMRPTGPGDKGLDVAGFVDDNKLQGKWDNYQCKHYSKSLSFGDVAPEIGKILWYSFNGVYSPPRSCVFVSPKGASTPLSLLLPNSENLRKKIVERWGDAISKKITSTSEVTLSGEFAKYVDDFDFKIFSSASPRSVIEAHKKTAYHPGRFGGGIPARPSAGQPPEDIDETEIIYTKKLLDAYAQHKGQEIGCHSQLKAWPNLVSHFGRSREAFYHAESLKTFVRDKADPGTFESLQKEILDGIVDTYDGVHPDGYARVVAVTDKAQTLSLDAHPLNKSAFPRDRRGICHQLANDGELTWKK